MLLEPLVYSLIMCCLVQLGSINTDFPFKSPILKLILADDFVYWWIFTISGVPDILFAGVQNVF